MRLDPTRPAGPALVLGPAAGERLQAGTELPVGCGEWLQDLKECSLVRKFSLRKSQSVDPDVCGSELKWTPCRGRGEAGGGVTGREGPPPVPGARAQSLAVGRALQSAPVGWGVIWFCSPVESFHNFLLLLVKPYKITNNLTFDLEDSSFR